MPSELKKVISRPSGVHAGKEDKRSGVSGLSTSREKSYIHTETADPIVGSIVTANCRESGDRRGCEYGRTGEERCRSVPFRLTHTNVPSGWPDAGTYANDPICEMLTDVPGAAVEAPSISGCGVPAVCSLS